MRSLLVAAADEERLAEALESGADAIIIDLAGAAPLGFSAARATAARLLKDPGRRSGSGPTLIVRTHSLDSGEIDSDLDVVMSGAPDIVLLPGSLGAASVQQLSVKLAVREADCSLADGATRVIAVADTVQSLFNLGSYRGGSARLIGLAWNAERIRVDIGAEVNQADDCAGPYRLARDLALLAATSAGVEPIDGVFADVRDLDGLRNKALAARRAGFTGKIALYPTQVGIINEVFRRDQI
jgi:citrate lyase subunit beta / citryl-CoA lyase